MNSDIFKAVMKPLLDANNVANRSVFASIMAKAYELSTVGFTGTTFGARLVKGDTAFLEKCINDALDANHADTTRGSNRSAYTLMAVGFMGYWASAKFTPTPFLPAMTTTIRGPVVKIPGILEPLASNIFYSFVLGYSDKHLDALTTCLKAYQRTIQGSIDGTTSTGSPVILPWVSII
jgi:hypothetical protein